MEIQSHDQNFIFTDPQKNWVCARVELVYSPMTKNSNSCTAGAIGYYSEA
jgi:hypothetical protein